MSQTYIAYDQRFTPITRVIATDHSHAAQRIREELSKRGRERYLHQWQDAGEIIGKEQ